MNEKIPLRRFAACVASHSDMDAAEAEEFIKSLFATIANGLRTGEPVSVPGLGEFRLTHNPDDPVAFIPETAWADEVNAPFAMFEPVELADGITDTQLAEAEQTEPRIVTAAYPSGKSPEQETHSEPEAVVEQPSPRNQEPAPAHEPVSAPTATHYRWPEEEEEEAEHLEAETAAKANEADAQATSPTAPPPSPQPVPDTSVVNEADITTEPYEAISTAQEDECSVNESGSDRGFSRGFVMGLIVGLAIGALALCAYVLYYVNMPAGQLPQEVEIDATEIVPAN